MIAVSDEPVYKRLKAEPTVQAVHYQGSGSWSVQFQNDQVNYTRKLGSVADADRFLQEHKNKTGTKEQSIKLNEVKGSTPTLSNQNQQDAPGRLPSSGLSRKTNFGTADMRKKMSAAKGNMEGGKAAAINAATARFSAADAQNRLSKALNQAHKTERAPTQPQYRISLLEGGMLIGVAGMVDVINWIAGFFAVVIVGEIVVIVIDVIFGILLACYCKFKLKLPVLAHIPIYISILGATMVDMIPFVNVVWWLDAWYIVHTIRKEDRQTHKQLLQTIEEERQEGARQDWMDQYQQMQAQESA